MPKPLTKQVEGKTKRLTQNINKNTSHSLVQKWVKRYNELGGKSCYRFNETDLEAIKSDLEGIARYKIKYEAMKHVEDRSMLAGLFTFERKFSSVPEACRWLEDQIEEVTFNKLLNEIRSERIVIQNGDGVLDDSKKLYNNAYSWYKNQLEQGRKIPKE